MELGRLEPVTGARGPVLALQWQRATAGGEVFLGHPVEREVTQAEKNHATAYLMEFRFGPIVRPRVVHITKEGQERESVAGSQACMIFKWLPKSVEKVLEYEHGDKRSKLRDAVRCIAVRQDHKNPEGLDEAAQAGVKVARLLADTMLRDDWIEEIAVPKFRELASRQNEEHQRAGADSWDGKAVIAEEGVIAGCFGDWASLRVAMDEQNASAKLRLILPFFVESEVFAMIPVNERPPRTIERRTTIWRGELKAMRQQTLLEEEEEDEEEDDDA